MSDQDQDSASQPTAWTGDDLEQAYQQALQKIDVAEREISQALADFAQTSLETEADESSADASTHALTEALAAQEVPVSTEETAAALLAELSVAPESQTGDEPIHPRQIIEAALFVGGQPLTAKRLCSVLKREFDQSYVERRIDELNALYTTECRPYEILLGEGGYRLQLRPEFTSLRDRVFGLGPREVKLSRDALEILSFISYRQPVSERDLAEAGRPKSGAVIRQLLRRDLIILQRCESSSDVKYKTSDRFLELFGLGSIDELPTTEDFAFK